MEYIRSWTFSTLVDYWGGWGWSSFMALSVRVTLDRVHSNFKRNHQVGSNVAANGSNETQHCQANSNSTPDFLRIEYKLWSHPCCQTHQGGLVTIFQTWNWELNFYKHYCLPLMLALGICQRIWPLNLPERLNPCIHISVVDELPWGQ